MRRDGQLVAASWNDALRAAAEALRAGLDSSGAEHLGVLGGARLTNEAAYAWAKLAKGVLGTDNIDCQLADGLPPEVVFGLPRATIDDACADGATVLVLGARPQGGAARPVPPPARRGREPRRHASSSWRPSTRRSHRCRAASLRYRPGEAGAVLARSRGSARWGRPRRATGRRRRRARAALLAAGDRLVVVLGRPSVAESESTIVDAAAAVTEAFPSARILSVLRRANVHGALDMGLTPGVLPGHVTLADGGEWFTGHGWERVPGSVGLDARGMLDRRRRRPARHPRAARCRSPRRLPRPRSRPPGPRGRPARDRHRHPPQRVGRGGVGRAGRGGSGRGRRGRRPTSRAASSRSTRR